MVGIVGYAGAAGTASVVAPELIRGGRKLSIEVLDYDFFGLGMKLLVYFSVSLIIAKFIEASLYKDNVLASLIGFLGLGIPQLNFTIGNPDAIKYLKGLQTAPDIKTFWENGIGGVKYWEIVKLLAILLVIGEWIRYNQGNDLLNGKASPVATGIFAMILGFLFLITVPELWERFKKGELFGMQNKNMEAMK